MAFATSGSETANARARRSFNAKDAKDAKVRKGRQDNIESENARYSTEQV
jgi:hypothetical protein